MPPFGFAVLILGNFYSGIGIVWNLSAFNKHLINPSLRGEGQEIYSWA
jgi:hypothetical protein